MWFRSFSLLALGVLFGCAAPDVPAHGADPLHLIVLHTNDVHGQVLPRAARWVDADVPPLIGGLPRVAGYVRAVREEARRTGAELLVVDAGDWFQGTPEGQIEGGAGFLAAMDEVGYDAMAIGNHEFDHGLPHLQALLDGSQLPAICANLDQADGQRVDWVDPWIVVERGGLRIGIIGLVAVETPSITHPDARALTFVDHAQALSEAREALAAQVDWFLPLTHIGLGDDRELARAHPDLDVIVGGHSHTFLREGVNEGDVRIVQVGSKASAVGRIDIWFDSDTLTVERLETRAVELFDEIPETWRNAQVEAICAALAKESERRMGVVIGELATPLARAKGPLTSSPAGNLITDLFRERTGADVALMNRGGIRTDLPAGPVTRRDVFELLPFDNHLVTIELSGSELAEVLRRSVENEAHSGLEVSGVELLVQQGESGRRLAETRVGDDALMADALYDVTINSFMAQGGDGYLDDGTGMVRSEDLILMRDVLEDAFLERGTIRPTAENRYVLLSR